MTASAQRRQCKGADVVIGPYNLYYSTSASGAFFCTLAMPFSQAALVV